MRRSRAPTEDSPLTPSRTSAGLAVVGVAMLVVQGMVADAGGADDVTRWPWDVVQDPAEPLALRAMHVLWAATAIWALATAFTRAARARAAGLAVLGTAVVVVAMGRVGLFTVGAPVPAEWLGLTILGGGLLIAREPGRRGLGRAVGGLGALLVLWVLATSFPPEGGPNRLQGYGFDVAAAFDDLGTRWRDVLGPTLLLLGCACGLLAMLGWTARGLLWTGVIAVLLGLLGPGVLEALDAAEFRVALLVPTLVPATLWALGALTAEDLSRGAA